MFWKMVLTPLWLYLLSAPSRAVAQEIAAPNTAIVQVRFDVASVRPSRPGLTAHDAGVIVGDYELDARAATVGDVLDMLNGWQHFHVIGGPAWMWADRYDIHAKASAPIPKAQRQAAVLALLGDRFKLVVHRETRDIPAITLRAPQRPAGLKPAADGEAYSISYNAHGDPVFVAAPMVAVTNYLAQMLQAPVSDQTGLQGAFDFSIAPSQIDGQPGETWGDRVREALIAFGFKVDMRKVTTEVTVVDHCERPSEN